ncbi:hypothetical protein Tco_0064476 [Tanacetum coccineum]
MHFLNVPENSLEVLKILENNLESLKVLKNNLESLKLQVNRPVDGLLHAKAAYGTIFIITVCRLVVVMVIAGWLELQRVAWDCSGSPGIAADQLQLQRVDCSCSGSTAVAAGWLLLWTDVNAIRIVTQRRYSDNKCKFKDKWFNKKTVEQARHEKPPKWKAV